MWESRLWKFSCCRGRVKKKKRRKSWRGRWWQQMDAQSFAMFLFSFAVCGPTLLADSSPTCRLIDSSARLWAFEQDWVAQEFYFVFVSLVVHSRGETKCKLCKQQTKYEWLRQRRTTAYLTRKNWPHLPCRTSEHRPLSSKTLHRLLFPPFFMNKSAELKPSSVHSARALDLLESFQKIVVLAVELDSLSRLSHTIAILELFF